MLKLTKPEKGIIKMFLYEKSEEESVDRLDVKRGRAVNNSSSIIMSEKGKSSLRESKNGEEQKKCCCFWFCFPSSLLLWQTVVTLINLLYLSFKLTNTIFLNTNNRILWLFIFISPCSFRSYLLSESACPAPIASILPSPPFLISVSHIIANVSLQYNILIV